RALHLDVRAALSGRTRELERLAVELYAQCLSTRDTEDTFTDETGRRLLSRAAVSEITEKLWAEYEDFCKRDLDWHRLSDGCGSPRQSCSGAFFGQASYAPLTSSSRLLATTTCAGRLLLGASLRRCCEVITHAQSNCGLLPIPELRKSAKTL
ncbi:MAG: transposase, partial [Roseiarcus sp.]